MVGCAGERAVEPVRRLLRHRLGPAAAQAGRDRADAGPRRPLRPGTRGRRAAPCSGRAARSPCATHDHEAPLSPAHPRRPAGRAAARAPVAAATSWTRAWPPPLGVCRMPPDRPGRRRRAASTTRRCCAPGWLSCARHRPTSRRRSTPRSQALNGDADALDRPPQRQNYRLAYWRTAAEELSYRRFFDIETLAGLRVEDDAVFADTHRLCSAWSRDGVGRRAADRPRGRPGRPRGLPGPAARGRPAAATSSWRRSSAPGEELPGSWPVAGTSGYDFLNRGQPALHRSGRRRSAMLAGYTALHRPATSRTPEIAHAAKLQIMREEPGRRDRAADRAARRRLRAAPPPARPHPAGAARRAARGDRRLRGLPPLCRAPAIRSRPPTGRTVAGGRGRAPGSAGPTSTPS